jgi:hypothetical protein
MQPAVQRSATSDADQGARLHEVWRRKLEIAVSQLRRRQRVIAEQYRYAKLCTVVLAGLAAFEALQAIAARDSSKSAAYPLLLVAMNLLTGGWTGFNAWRRWVEAKAIDAFLKWCASELERDSG